MRVATLTLAVVAVSSVVSSAPIPANVRRSHPRETVEQYVDRFEKRNGWDFWSKYSPSNIFRGLRGSKTTKDANLGDSTSEDLKLGDLKLQDSKPEDKTPEDSRLQDVMLDESKLHEPKLDSQPSTSSTLEKDISDAVLTKPKKKNWFTSRLFQKKPKTTTQASLKEETVHVPEQKEPTQDELDALAKAKADAQRRKDLKVTIGVLMTGALGVSGVITWAALREKAYRRCMREPFRKGCEKYVVVTNNDKSTGDTVAKPGQDDQQKIKSK